MSTTPDTDAVRPRTAPPSGCPFHNTAASPARAQTTPARVAGLVYGALSYTVFLAVFLYAMGFVADVIVPRTVNRAIEGPLAKAILVDLGLLTVFALQHSVMARPAFKRWWTRYIPSSIERSTYVLFASAALTLLFWQWRSIDVTIWNVDWSPARIALMGLGWAGWAIVLASTFMIDHFELFGLRQVIRGLSGRPMDSPESGFRTVLFYRLVRHPLMLGFLIAFWATPTMTAGHLLFAAVTTGYILIALQLEERDLVDALGETYRHYRNRVPMLLPRLWR
jgi:methanethiol S-methyltransferase